MNDFSRFTAIICQAFQESGKQDEIIARKQALLNEVYEYHNMVPSTTLFIGFNPAVFTNQNGSVTVTGIPDSVKAYLTAQGVNCAYADIDQLLADKTRFDCVVAADEFFTFSTGPEHQQNLVTEICGLAQEFVISTVRDYKNQDYKDREFSMPAVVRGNKSTTVWYEFHDWDYTKRTMWTSYLHGIDLSRGLVVADQFSRHTMYFKQLAKFSADAGAVDFTVHKNIMCKSVIRKNYEHVVSIRFER